ncbi:MFS transporter [Streptomyces sp. NPDC006335]|uniref:MFS transporter n=1 Tax=Streptomyces sp. NPDC006335 TaxID=3156895 RepID=UPI0033ACD886
MPHAARLLGGTLIGRMPTGMAPLAIVLVGVEAGSFGVAGGLAALYLLANAAGGPLSGRLIDRHGQTWPLVAGAIVAGAGFLSLAAAGDRPTVAVVSVAAAGLARPPHDASLRALWNRLLPSREHERVALSLDAASQEIIYIVGPLTVAAVAVTGSPRAALVVTAVVGLAGTLLVVSTPPSRSWRGRSRRPDWLGPLRSRGLRPVYLAMLCAGIPMGALTPLAVQVADRLHDADLAGTLPASVSVGALFGGLVYGVRSWPGSTPRHLVVLTGAFGASWLLLLMAESPAMTLAVGLLPGLFMAPLLAAAYLRTSALAPTGSVTEAAALLVAAQDIGCAVGAALAGLFPTPALLPVGSTAACLVLLIAHGLSRRPVTALDGTKPLKTSA